MERDPEQAPGEVEVGEVDEGVGVVVGAGDEAGWGECVPVPGREENVFASAAAPQHLTKLEIPVFIKHVRSAEARWYENRFLQAGVGHKKAVETVDGVETVEIEMRRRPGGSGTRIFFVLSRNFMTRK